MLTGLRLEGRIGVGWTYQVRPDYHVQLGAYSVRTSAPVWEGVLTLPSAAADVELRLQRRFVQSVLPGPPSLAEFRTAVRAGRRFTERLRADTFLQHGRLVYQDRLLPGTADRGRIDVARLGVGIRLAVTARWSLGAVYQRNYWHDPFFADGLPDRTGSAVALTFHYGPPGGGPSVAFLDSW